MVLSCIVKGYPTPAAQIVKLSEDSNETGDDDQWKLLDMVSNPFLTFCYILLKLYLKRGFYAFEVTFRPKIVC